MKLQITLIILFLVISNLFSQQNNFKTYSIESGLSQSIVYCMIQDKRGYLWLGTDGGGVCRFDGINFSVFGKKQGISSNVVRSLFEDSKGNIWIGTDKGISFYNGYKFTTIDTSIGLTSGTILNFSEDKKGNIWAAGDNGLNKITVLKNKLFEIQNITTKDGLETNFIFDVHEDKKGNIWLAMYGGINILKFNETGFSVEMLSKDDVLSSNIITCIEEDKNGDLWFGTYDAGAIKIYTKEKDNRKVEFYNKQNGLNGFTIWDIMQDTKGNIWFCTDKTGVSKFDNTSFTYYSEKQGMPNNQILCMIEDNENNIWFGTMGNGLIRFLGNHFSHYNKNDGLFNEQITSIIKDKSNDFWISSLGDGVMQVKFKNNIPTFKKLTTKNGLIDNNVNSLFVDGADNLWISTQKGISILIEGNFISINEENGLIDNRVNCVLVDKKEIIWIGTGAGLSIYNNGEYFNITKDSEYEIANDQIQTIIESRDSNIWIGTLGGLMKFRKGEMTQYDEAEGLNYKTIHALVEDSKGNILIGTFGGGLYLFDNNTSDTVMIKNIADNSMLGSPNIYSLVFQDKNTLIVGTDKGFDKILFDDNMNIVKVKNYDRTDGFLGVENKLNSVYNDNEGNVWFGTVNGLTKYTPENEKINEKTPVIHLTGIDLFYESIDWTTKADSMSPWFNIPSNLELKYSDNHLTFKFSAISLSNPNKIKYKYMLQGVETNWSPVRTDNEVVYSSLAPGDYVFKIIAANENGKWNEKPYEFHFSIMPPFWKTLWFIISVVILVIVLIYLFIRLREKKLKHEKAVLEQKVVERTREIAEKNEELNQQNEEILEKKEIIEEKNKDIMDSIRYAKRIQEALLPPNDFVNKFLKNSFVLYKPKDIVSGDFYWMHNTEDKILFAAIDCTGHGVPGAFMSIVGHNGLNQAIIEHGTTQPAEVLNHLNQIVSNTLGQKSNDTTIRDGMDMVLCCIDYKKKILEFAGANNPLYMIRDGELIVTKGDKHPIGAYDDETLKPFTNHVIQLRDDDVIMIFSDGYADQFGGAAGKKYKYKNFKDLLIEHHEKPMEEQKKIYDDTIEEWRGDLEQIDDILLIGVRV